MARLPQHAENVLELFEKWDIRESLVWHTDGEGLIRFYVNCNDLFGWGLADAEEIELGDVADINDAMKAVRAVEEYSIHGLNLFACRKRRCRPQNLVMRFIEPSVRALFDECGPPRND